MKTFILATSLVVGACTLLPSAALAQSAGQDLKDAGKNTTDAAKKGATAVGHGVKKGATTTTHAVKKGANKGASETEKGASKVKDKTTTTGTSN